MKTKILVLSFASLILFSNKAFSQGEAAIPFLTLQPSPSLAAMGATGTALPTEDPFGFLWNPAQLGYTSQNNNFSFIFYPSKTEWLPEIFSDFELKGVAMNFGYNFKDLIGFPLSVGLGYSYNELDYGSYEYDISDSKDYYHAYSLGVGIDYSVQFNAGFTYKSITSVLSDKPVGQEQGIGKAEPNVFDFGLLINIPVLKLIDEDMQIELANNMFLKPDFNFSLGYSKSNIGDEVYYIDPSQADPLPRTDRLGYGISTGFDFVDDDFQIKAFNLSFTVEAKDLLIEQYAKVENGQTIYDWKYQSTLSDLKFWKDIIAMEGSENILVSMGIKLDFFETFTYYHGFFNGSGFDEQTTNGFEVRAKGFLKLLALSAKAPFTDFLSDHIDIRYYNTNYFDNDWRKRLKVKLS